MPKSVGLDLTHEDFTKLGVPEEGFKYLVGPYIGALLFMETTTCVLLEAEMSLERPLKTEPCV